MTYVSSAAEDPPEERTHCRCCGEVLCLDCGECEGRDDFCLARACLCPSPLMRRAQAMADARWQEALDDATDGAIDDAKVREVEGHDL